MDTKDAPAWRFANKIQNVIGGVNPHGVIRVTNDLAEAYDWLKYYNECHDASNVEIGG
jgi:hypothetical protein